MKTLRKIVVGGMVLVSLLTGCGKIPEPSREEGTFRGYKIIKTLNNPVAKRQIAMIDEPEGFILDETGSNLPPLITGVDRDGDEYFEYIYKHKIPKGHPLEAYANQDSLETAWNEMKK